MPSPTLIPSPCIERFGAMQHDTRLRETARAIYEAVYPGVEWTDLAFYEAEKYATPHYRNAVDAAQRANASLNSDRDNQLAMPL